MFPSIPGSGKTAVEELAAKQLENEWQFAACVLHSQDIAVQDCAWLQPDFFINKDLGKFWKEVLEHGDAIKSANNLGLTTVLVEYGLKLPSVITPATYAEGIDSSRYFINTVRHATNIVKASLEKDFTKIQVEIEGLSSNSQVSGVIYHTAEDIDEEFTSSLGGNHFPVVKSYLPDLDRTIGGFFGGDLITVASRPGVGKTALTWVIARNAAFDGKKVAYFSLEMSRTQLWARGVCGHAGYSWSDVRLGNIDDAGRKKITEISAEVRKGLKGNLVVIDDAFTVAEIIQACALIKPDFVIVDLLGEINWDDPKEKEVTWYGKALKILRQRIAKRMGIPLIVNHHLNREVEGQADKRPILKDLRWSGEIEQRSDVVLMLYREDYYLPNVSATVVPIEVIARKNRQGSANATAVLQYDLEKQDFR